MRKQIIITLILLAATAFVTVVYFKNLNPPGTRTSQVMRLIPDNASLVFEFNNDKGFYDIFKDNRLFAAIISKQKLGQLDTLRQVLLQNPLLSKYFTAQDLFISLHPSKTNGIELLLSASPATPFDPEIFDKLSKQAKNGLVITPIRKQGKSGYNIYVNILKTRFYIINKGDNVFSGSFSEELAEQSATYKHKTDKPVFILLSEQQSNNSLVNLYVNYSQLSPLFEELFRNKNTDILKTFRMLPAVAALSLNYRSDAIMFNGSTTIQKDGPSAYLKPVREPATGHQSFK